MKKNQVLLVDGMALLFRGFFATSFRGNFMLTSKGVPTNGIYQFLRYLLDAVDKFEPTHVVCCWDMGSKTFRTEMYAGYKANRDEPPVELVPQFDLVKEVTEAMDIPNVGIKGYEADDCIGTLANIYKGESDVYILTGDQDILQLLDERVKVVLLKKGYGNYDIYDVDRFQEEKGITPKQMIELKAIMGDSSDNYPGVRGVGEKTALKLLKQFGSLDEILANLDQLTKAQRTKFETDLEMVQLCRKLAEIYCEADVDCHLDDAVFEIDRDKVVAKFEELEFKRIDSLLS